MKKILIILLICGFYSNSFGQIVKSYKFFINNDTTALNFEIENKKVVLGIKANDVIRLTFDDLKEDMTVKTVSIISDSNDEEDILIGDFEKQDINEDRSYSLDITFVNILDKLYREDQDKVFMIRIYDKTGHQDLLRIKAVKE